MRILRLLLACTLWVSVHLGASAQDIFANDMTGLLSAISDVNNSATGGQTIHLNPTNSYIIISNPLPAITKPCTIDGHGAVLKNTFTGELRLLRLTGAGTVTVKNLHLTGGKLISTGEMGSAILAENTNLNLIGCEVSSCSAQTFNGAIALSTATSGGEDFTLSVQNCYIHDNTGKGIQIAGDVNKPAGFLITNTTIANNTVGGLHVFSGNGGGVQRLVKNCTFFNNGQSISNATIFISNPGAASSTEMQTYFDHCTITKSYYGVTVDMATVNFTGTAAMEFTGAVGSYVSGSTPISAFDPSVGENITSVNTQAGFDTALRNVGGFAPVLVTSAGCAAIDPVSGSPTELDQRGAQPAGGKRDIGAYEFGGAFANDSAPFTVSNTNPFGLGSLYAAINNANNQPTGAGIDDPIIRFNIAITDINYTGAGSNVWAISPLSGANPAWSGFIKDADTALPTLTRANTVINGEAVPNTGQVTSANTAQIKIELKGNYAGNASGLRVSAANCIIDGLSIHSYSGVGIYVESTATNCRVRGCYLGLSAQQIEPAQAMSEGVFLNNTSNAVIGGNLPAYQNIICGSTVGGITINSGSGHIIQGNAIGVNKNKDTAMPNAVGIVVSNFNPSSASDKLLIGAAASDNNASNLISGNTNIQVQMIGSSHIDIFKNFIGTTGAGTPLLVPNSFGIALNYNCSNVNIGDGADTGLNIIGGHKYNIYLNGNGGTSSPVDINIRKNAIGISPDGLISLGGEIGVFLASPDVNKIFISENIIDCQSFKPISLSAQTNEMYLVTPQIPIVSLASSTSISGQAVNGAIVEVYADAAGCPTTHRQARYYLGTTTANATGAWTLSNFTLPTSPNPYYVKVLQHIGATHKSTSEMSDSLQINRPPTSSDKAVTLLEDTEYTFDDQVDFPFSDPDVPTTSSQAFILTSLNIPAGCVFYVDANDNSIFDVGEEVFPGKTFPASQKLKFKAAPDAAGSNYATFGFRVYDGTDYSIDAYTMTIHVTGVNDAPVIGASNPPSPILMSPSLGVQTIQITGIGAGGGSDEAIQSLAAIASHTNPSVGVLGTSSYTSPNTTMTISYTPQTVGVDTLKVLISDNATPILTTLGEFIIEVKPNINAPNSLTATLSASNTIALTWAAGDANATGYEVFRDINDSGTFTSLGGTQGLNFTDINVSVGNKYCYKVRATSSYSVSDYSELACETVQILSQAPTELTAEIPTSTPAYILLKWKDNSTDEAGFFVERKSIFSLNDFEQIAVLGENITTYLDESVSPNVDYVYRVRAFNQLGQPSAYSNEASITSSVSSDPLPAPPDDLIATSVSPQQIDVEWAYEPKEEIVYMLERSTSPTAGFTEIARFFTEDQTSTKYYNDTQGLVAGTLYYYRVRARTGSGTSDYSDVDSARAVCNLRDLAIVRTDNGKEVICAGKSAAMGIVVEVKNATYQWKRNGIPIEGATFKTYNASRTGVYSCQIAVGACSALSINTLFVAVLGSPEELIVQQEGGELVASINDADAYQWYVNYTPISGATGRRHKPTKNGVYYVTAAVESCMSTSSVYSYNVSANEPDDLSAHMQLSPNPARLQTEVRLASPAMGAYTFRILDTKGKVIRTFVGKKEDWELTRSLDVQNLPAGMYVLECAIQNKKGYKKLIVR